MRGTAKWTIGVPGSGKSTWAENNMEPFTLRLERDMFRCAMWGGRKAYFAHRATDLDKSMLLGSTIYNAMNVALRTRTHTNILISDMGIHWNAVRRFWELAGTYGLARQVVVFNVSWEMLEQRNAAREGTDQHLPPAVLRRCFDEMWDEKAWWRAVGNRVMVNEKGEPQ